MFILAIIFTLIGIVALIVAASNARARVVAAGDTPNGSAFRRGTNVIISRAARWTAIAVFFLALVFLAFSSFFRQDVGQANVLRDWTGNIVGTETASGLHPKAPWVDVVTFDVRNQRAVFVSEQEPGQGDNIGGVARRPADHGAGCRGRHGEHRHRDPVLPRSRCGQRHLQRVLQRGQPQARA